MRSNRNWRIRKGATAVVMVALAIVVFGYGTERLWNWLMPSIFSLRTITFGEALGLLILSKILFSGFGGRGRGGRGWGRDRWKEGLKERWDQMTPEERTRFQTGMRGRRNWCSDWSNRAEQPSVEQATEQRGA